MAEKTIISICLGSSCFSRGNNTNLKIIQDFLVERGLEKQVEIVGNLCTGNCSKGPNLTIGEKTYSGVDAPETLRILEHHFPIKRGQE